MKRTTLFVRSSLILTLILFSSFSLSYASHHLEDEMIQRQSLSKAVTRHSQEPPASYGDFDVLSEDLLFHQILPHCDRNIIQVNRSFFTLVTGYTSNHILDQGFESKPTKPICCLHGHTFFDFYKHRYDMKQMPSFVWSLIREVEDIPSSVWFYLKGSQIHTVNLSYNQIGDDGARTFGQSLQGTRVQTVDLSGNKIGANGARALGQSLKGTQVQTLDLSCNNITLDMQVTLNDILLDVDIEFKSNSIFLRSLL